MGPRAKPKRAGAVQGKRAAGCGGPRGSCEVAQRSNGGKQCAAWNVPVAVVARSRQCSRRRWQAVRREAWWQRGGAAAVVKRGGRGAEPPTARGGGGKQCAARKVAVRRRSGESDGGGGLPAGRPSPMATAAAGQQRPAAAPWQPNQSAEGRGQSSRSGRAAGRPAAPASSSPADEAPGPRARRPGRRLGEWTRGGSSGRRLAPGGATRGGWRGRAGRPGGGRGEVAPGS